MKTAEAPCEVNIAVSIREVKRQDLVVQDTVGLTMIDGNKREHSIPFAEDVKYKFDSLMKNFVFKYAILQQEEILGVLYLEIPFKYKFTKKFKIDDWYPLKPFDGRPGNKIDSSLVARVVISYDSNCKLDPRKYESIEDLKEVHPNSAQKDYKTELRKIRRTSAADKENNLNYLEEVERNIMNRRKRNVDSSGYASMGRTGSTESMRLLRSSSKTSTGIKAPLSRALTSRKRIPGAGIQDHNSVTPDDMYRTAGSTVGRNGLNDDKVIGKMAAELATNKQEIKELREKLKALQEGQMTVDNLQLSKRLDEERAAMNVERAKMLKEYANLKEEAESLKKKTLEQKQKSEEELIKQKQELEDRKRMLDLDLKQLALADDELRSRN